MADFHRLDQPITSVQDIINALQSFLLATASGPSWTEDATFTSGANPGNLFLETTAGAASLYVFFKSETVLTKTVLQCYWVPSASNGFGGGSGPQNAHSAPGAFFYVDTGLYDYDLDMYADENRCVAILKSAPKAAAGSPGIPEEEGAATYQVMYFGRMTSHAGGDTYPNVVLGNGLYTVKSIPDAGEYGFFPESMAKRVGPGGLIFGQVKGKGWDSLYDHTFKPPKNSLDSEAFAYSQDIHVRYPGADESFSLSGCVLTTPDVGLFQDVTVDGTIHTSFPGVLKGSLRETLDVAPVYLVIKGSLI